MEAAIARLDILNYCPLGIDPCPDRRSMCIGCLRLVESRAGANAQSEDSTPGPGERSALNLKKGPDGFHITNLPSPGK